MTSECAGLEHSFKVITFLTSKIFVVGHKCKFEKRGESRKNANEKKQNGNRIKTAVDMTKTIWCAAGQ